MQSNNSPASDIGFALHTLKKSGINIESRKKIFGDENKLTKPECVSLMPYFNISVAKYKLLKKFFDDRGSDLFHYYEVCWLTKRILSI